MKCPNCGNEAINVNGKFVCLDCGIEISTQTQTASTVPQVGNHLEPATNNDTPQPVAATPVANVEPTSTEVPREKVITPPTDMQPTASLKDQYMAELEKEEQQSGGSFDFSTPASAPTPDFPVGTDTPAAEPAVQIEALAPQAPTAVAEPPAPVTDFSNIFKNQTSSAAEPAPAVTETPATPSSLDFNVLNGFNPSNAIEEAQKETPAIETAPPVAVQPESEVSALAAEPPVNPFDVQLPPVANLGDPVPESAPETPIAELVMPELPPQNTFNQEVVQVEEPVTEPQSIPADSNPEPAGILETSGLSDETQSAEAPVISLPEQAPVAETASTESLNPFAATPQPEPEEVEIPINAIPKPTEPMPSAPADYFKPASLDITNHAEEVAPAVAEPIAPVGLEPALEPSPMPAAAPVFESGVPEAPFTPAGGGLDLDTLLDKYSSPASSGYQTPALQGGAVDSVRPAQYANYDLAKENPAPTSEIPSVESVFEDGYVDPNPAIQQQAKKNNKIKIFIIIGIIFLMLMGGLAALVIYTANSGQQGLSAIAAFEKETMEAVPKKIEEAQSIKATFKESVDFSQLSLKSQIPPAEGQALLSLFASPLVNEGSWETNSNNDISQNTKVGSTSYVKVYNEDTKMTYVSNGSTWTKKEGRLIEGIPVFYSASERGSLFYDSKIDKLTYLKKEAETEKYEFRVTPKPDLVKESILSLSPLLAKAKIESVDVTALSIIARVDAENKLDFVSIKGEVMVKSDLFEGVITYDSFANYSYGFTEIEIPQVYKDKDLNKIFVQIPGILNKRA